MCLLQLGKSVLNVLQQIAPLTGIGFGSQKLCIVTIYAPAIFCLQFLSHRFYYIDMLNEIVCPCHLWICAPMIGSKMLFWSLHLMLTMRYQGCSSATRYCGQCQLGGKISLTMCSEKLEVEYPVDLKGKRRFALFLYFYFQVSTIE